MVHTNPSSSSPVPATNAPSSSSNALRCSTGGVVKAPAAALTRKNYEIVESATVERTMSMVQALMVMFPSRFSSLTSAKKALRRKVVLVNDEFAGVVDEAAVGARVDILTRTTGAPKLPSSDLPEQYRNVAIVYEDAHCAIMVKPDGVATVGGGGWTAERMAAYLCKTPDDVEGVLARPRPVHRLDEATGGLLVIAKTREGMLSLSRAFADRAVKKRYRAILKGRLEQNEGECDTPLGGKASLTKWKVVSTVKSTPRGGRVLTLVDYFPQTGRTHQLRRHSHALMCPILGDKKYRLAGEEATAAEESDGLFLWSVGVTIPASAMPWRGDDLCINVDEAAKFAKVMRGE